MSSDHPESSLAAPIYNRIPGGRALLDWFGYAPNFHDGEIVELSLRRRPPSILRIHTWRTTRDVDERGFLVLDKHVVVSFFLDGLMDLQLDGFSHQNVIFRLVLAHAPDRPDRRPFYAFAPSPDDFEIELQPCYGLDGRLRCKKVWLELQPGKPADVK